MYSHSGHSKLWIKRGPKIYRNNSETLGFESKILNEEEMSNSGILYLPFAIWPEGSFLSHI